MTVMTDDDFVRLFQERFGLTVDGWAGKDTVDKLNQLAPPKILLEDITEIPENYWPLLEQIESGGKLYAKAATSTGSGLYQFLRSTWLGEGGAWGNDLSKPFGGLQPTRQEQLQRAKTLTAKNANYLRKQGLQLNRATLYAAHFFGPVTAAKVILADVKERADLIAGPAATKANKSILENKSVGQFLTWLKNKTGDWAR